MNLVEAVAMAYLLAGLPVGAAALAGRMTPMYRLERGVLLRWWGWGAVAIIVCVILQTRLLPLVLP